MIESGEKTFHIVSLGCPKNLVDSEVMAGLLAAAGYRSVAHPRDARTIIVNTCAFILPAKEEAIEAILLMARYKSEGSCGHLLVTGCLPQRYGAELAQSLPEVDLFLGIAGVPHIAAHLTGIVTKENDSLRVKVGKPTFLMNAAHPRRLMTPPYTAYLKIAEGCDNRCTYCVIPDIRGPYRSRSIPDILTEAEALARQGVKELILIAQDTTAYGQDIRGAPKLIRLLKELTAVEGLAWIRLLYSYPTRITRELIECMVQEEKICPYLDMPVQHSDDNLLAAMHRRGDSKKLREIIAMVRNTGPDVALRSSLIVGFPGETKRRFATLLDFVREARFDHLGVFPYYREEGTPAAALPYRISAAEKERRREMLMEEQAAISGDLLRKRIGKVETVLLEGKSDRPDYPFLGRNSRQAPDIDGATLVKGKGLKPGRLVPVRILDADTYDLYGEVVDFSS